MRDQEEARVGADTALPSDVTCCSGRQQHEHVSSERWRGCSTAGDRSGCVDCSVRRGWLLEALLLLLPQPHSAPDRPRITSVFSISSAVFVKDASFVGRCPLLVHDNPALLRCTVHCHNAPSAVMSNLHFIASVAVPLQLTRRALLPHTALMAHHNS